MTYASREKILVADINGFISTNTPSVNGVWSTGTGNSGYGQTALSNAVLLSKVQASTWSTLLATITRAANHQGTAITAITPPVSRDLIQFYSALSSNITAISNSRLNAAGQGSTAPTSSTNTVSWSDYLQFDFTITFANHNSARYYFNSGGQIGITASHPDSGGINSVLNRIAAAMGTIWLSSPVVGSIILAGISYNGVTKIGGGEPAVTTINSNWGFYSWGAALTQVLQQKETSVVFGSYSADTAARISVSYNGSGVINVRVVFDEVPNGIAVATGTNCTLSLRYPSETYLTNTWGTATVTSTITRA